MKCFNHQPVPLTFKAVSTLCVLLLSTTLCFSQMNVAIAPNKMNVLYIGVDNPISVAASGGTDDKVTLSISGTEGRILKTGTGLYNVQVATVTDNCVINVYVDGKPAGSSQFRVRKLPHPAATIGGYASGSNIVADVFKKQAGLGVYVKDSPFDIKYEVVSYTLSVDDEKGQVISAESKSALFSDEAKQYIGQHVKPGSTITIDAILAKDPAGKIIKLPALVYYTK